MSGPLIAIVAVVYAIIAADQFSKDNPAMGVVWLGYAASNVGLYFVSR